MAESDNEIHAAGRVINARGHICAFFHNKEEEFRTLLPFILDGLAQDDKVVRIVHESGLDEYRRRLRAEAVGIDDAEKRGQLEVSAWPGMDLHDALDCEDRALERIEEHLTTAHRQGYSRVRLFGDWAFQGRVYSEDFISYEARLNTMLSKYDDTVFCVYDLSLINGDAVVAAMRTHPIAIVGGVVQQNPFYVPPEQILDELRGREGCA
jgi:hypothetical protein